MPEEILNHPRDRMIVQVFRGELDAMAPAEDIREKIEALNIPHHDSPTVPRITVSLGVVTARYDRTPSTESIVEPCDLQLYAAKASGRNRVCGINLAID